MIEITAKTEATFAALRRLGLAIEDRTAPNKQLATQLLSWIFRNYDAEGGLVGGWAPLKPGTIEAKRRRGYSERILVRTGNLRSKGFQMFYDKNEAGVGVRSGIGYDYAEAHEKGVPENNLPRRQLLPDNSVASEYAVRVFGLFIEANIRREGLK